MRSVTPQAVVEWGEHRKVAVTTAVELDQALLQADQEARDRRLPQAVEVTGAVNAGTLAVVVGSTRSFVHHVPADGNPPYMASLGKDDDDRPFTFYVHGDHHTEADWRNTVTPQEARTAARHFLVTGELDPRLRWEEI